jgi:ATP-binding cassette subfamily B multidrug efflux pump
MVETVIPAKSTPDPVKNPGLWAFSKRYAFPLWAWYLAGFLALAATNWVTLEIPQLAKSIVDRLAAGEDPLSGKSIALMIIGLGVLQIVIRSTSRILIFWPGRTIEAVSKTDLFTRCLTLPQAFLLKFGMGDLISRLANDVGQLRVFFAFGLLQIANLVFLVIFTISRMMSVHVGLTLAAIAPLALMLLITRWAMPRMQYWSRMNQEAIGRLTNRVTEAFVNVHVIQANAAENAFVGRMDEENSEVYRTNMKLVLVRNVIFPLMNCLAGLAQVFVLYYGGWEVIQGRITVGDIMAFNVYIGFLSFPLTAVGMILAMWQRARTAVERTWELDLAEPERALPPSLVTSKSETESAPLLEVRSLTWKWPGRDKPLFENLSFSLRDGERIGIMGAIGTGKTTLFNMITRVQDPPLGTIFWKGRDVLEIEPAELRRNIGYAQQTVHLFSDTIANNLAWGLPPDQRNLDSLKTAAKKAEILAEIEHFASGWNTEIGEKGLRLSGGQKQRLALARVLARRPRLMILDDVLSAVDHETEAKLIQTFRSIGCTLMIASHRPSVLKECQKSLDLTRPQLI